MKALRLLLALLLVIGGSVETFAQATHVSTSGTLPASCRVGDVYYKTGASAGFYACTATNTWSGPYPTSGVAAAYSTVQDEASGLTQRSTLNFTGAGISCTDNSGSSRTDCTVSGSGIGSGGAAIPGDVHGRLTTESGVAVSTSDRTSQGTIYFTPFRGNTIAIFNSTAWESCSFTEMSLALSSLTSGKNYDVFVTDAGSCALSLELSAAWTNDTTRADALTTQDGVAVKSGATNKLHVATIRTTGTTTTEDSGGITGTSQTGGKRFVWNRYNQVQSTMKVIDTTDSWSYTTNTVRQANGASGNKVEYVTGDAATLVDAIVVANVDVGQNGTQFAKAGVGVDSTSAFSGIVGWGGMTIASNQIGVSMTGIYQGYPGLGYHYISWNEKGGASTSTFTGDDGADGSQSGLTVRISN